jgi:hypothetical protein
MYVRHRMLLYVEVDVCGMRFGRTSHLGRAPHATGTVGRSMYVRHRMLEVAC